jgi:hypothetical protein
MRESRTTTTTRTRRITKADPEVGQEARFTLADPAADIKNRLSRSFALPYFYREPGRIKIKIRSRSRSVQKLKAKSEKRKTVLKPTRHARLRSSNSGAARWRDKCVMRESRTTTRTRTRRITKADPEVGQEARFTLADPAAAIKNRLSRSFALPDCREAGKMPDTRWVKRFPAGAISWRWQGGG